MEVGVSGGTGAWKSLYLAVEGWGSARQRLFGFVPNAEGVQKNIVTCANCYTNKQYMRRPLVW
jgi:hypothetical protein